VTKLDDQNVDERGKDVIVQYDEATEKKMSEYEETMRLIKEATGVSDITEVIAKFQSQGDTLFHLTNLQMANEKRIEQLKKKKAEVIKEYEWLRFTGEAKQSLSQRTLDEFTTHLEEANVKYVDSKLKYDRSLKILSNAKAGVQHLNEKLESIRLVININFSLNKFLNICL
jgi:vacuolar-type H+-ATPase subunit I/STV1